MAIRTLGVICVLGLAWLHAGCGNGDSSAEGTGGGDAGDAAVGGSGGTAGSGGTTGSGGMAGVGGATGGAGGGGGVCTEDGWCWESGAPVGSAVWAFGPNDVWVLGGTLLHWNGEFWLATKHMEGGEFGASDAWGSSPDDLWAVGVRNIGGDSLADCEFVAAVIHWDGVAWTEQPLPTVEKRLTGIWGFETDDIWIVGSRKPNTPGPQEMYVQHWDGIAWSSPHVLPASLDFSSGGMWGSSPNDLWVAADNAYGGGALWHWDGSEWSSESAPVGRLWDLWGFATNDVWAAGSEMVHWDGSTWSETPSPGDDFHLSVWGASPNDVWAVGGGDVRRWDGTAWSSALTLDEGTEAVGGGVSG